MLTDILKQTPVLSIMTAIDSCLTDSDGLKRFNRLYMRVTRSIKLAVNPPAFRDARFMSELDVVFANMYFAAIAAGDVDPSRVASAFACAAELRDYPFAVRAGRHERAHQSRPPSRHRAGIRSSWRRSHLGRRAASGLRQRERTARTRRG